MALIHGNEWAASEQAIEFIYDVIRQSKTNPKVKALFDKVKFIAMPVVSPDGLALYRRQNANGVDMNRNYPFGWGSNIGVTFAQRGVGPGSEPEVQNTMDIVRENQVVALVTTHSASHAFFYPGLEIAAGLPADLSSIRDLSVAMANATNNGYTNVRDSAHDYETSGETIDWSYYATRGFAVTLEVVGGSSSCSGSNATNKGTQAPNWRNCMAADYTGTPGPTATANQIATYGGKPNRNSLYQALAYATLSDGHSVLKGSAPAGAKLKITKDFNLFTNRVQQQHDAAVDDAAAGDPDAPRVLDHGARFRPVLVEHQPVGAPEPAVPRRGHGPRPERLPAGVLDAHLHAAGRHRGRDASDRRSTRARRSTSRSARRVASAAPCRRRWR